MRNLKTKDLGLFSKIFAKMGISAEMKELTSEGKLATSLVLLIIENYWKAEEDFFQLLSNLTGKPISEIAESTLLEFKEIIEELVSDPAFESFFKLAAR